MRLVYLFLILIFIGCGSRKVNKSSIEEKVKTETTTEVKEETKTNRNEQSTTKIIDTSSTDEIEFIPVDNTKPMTINGKTYFNTILKHRKTKTNISIAKDKKVSQIEDKAVNFKSNEKKLQSTKVEIKKIDKEPIPFWYFILLLLMLGGVGYLIIYIRKKNESK